MRIFGPQHIEERVNIIGESTIMIIGKKSNLFNLDSLYRKMPKKSFIKGRKQEFEILFMYYWLHDMEGDDEGYWQEYLEKVLPTLKKL